MTPFTAAVIEIIRQIPEGEVMSYKAVATAAGNAGAARQVVRILHSMSGKYHLPWHRVINSKGEIGITDPVGKSLQRQLLEAEGIHFDAKGRILR